VIIVSDTTAITSLLKIGRTSLLNELFGEVLIPDGVKVELLKYHSQVPEFLRVCRVENKAEVTLLRKEIDEGEAQAIVLAQELQANALLIDDKQGRLLAESRGLRCIGLAGALLMAKENGLIVSLREILNDLETTANFYLEARLRNALLAKAREADIDS
jgi:predicted nucleic acid-binding protein